MTRKVGNRGWRRRSPSSLTSTARCAGMLVGRHSISISRVTRSRMPWSVFTPLATPTTSIGTLTVILTSIRTRTKSTWRGLRETGSRWSSRIMAWRLWSEPGQLQEEDGVLARAFAETGRPGPCGRPRSGRSAFRRRRRRPGSARRRGCAGPRSFRSSSASRRGVRWFSWPTPRDGRPRAKRRILHKKRGNGSPIVDPLDGLPQQGGHGKGPDPGAAGHGGVDRDGVGDEQGLQPGALDPLERGAREDPMDGGGVRPLRAPWSAGPPRPGPGSRRCR